MVILQAKCIEEALKGCRTKIKLWRRKRVRRKDDRIEEKRGIFVPSKGHDTPH